MLIEGFQRLLAGHATKSFCPLVLRNMLLTPPTLKPIPAIKEGLKIFRAGCGIQ